MLKAQIAVLVSGGGTNLQALLDAQTAGTLVSGEVALVVSNNPAAYALERAASHGIETLTLTGDDLELGLLEALAQRRIDLIVLAGFLHILSARVTAAYPNRILNVHPSLLPAFGGKGYYGLRVHEAALSRGVKLSGATVHFVNEIPDGGEIIAQKAVRVRRGDTPQSLQRRIMEQAEWKLLPRACQLVSSHIQKGTSAL